MESTLTKQQKTPMIRKAIGVAWPAVLESFFVALAGLIDTMMVASLGSRAVAAVSLTSQPKFLFLSPFVAVNIAVSALVARRKGEEKREDANETLFTAFLVTMAICALVTFLSIAFGSGFMTIAGSNPETHAEATLYFKIVVGGCFFQVLSMVINAAQRGSGYTRISMTTNLLSSVVNIIFNYLLIGGHFGFPALGVKGAALATVLGTVVAAVLSVASLFRKNSYVSVPFIYRKHLRPRTSDLRPIYSLASNLFIENLAMRVGFLTTAFLAARLGTDPFAAHGVGMNLLSLSFSFADGMQAAAVALSGEALGAGNKDGAIEYGRICQRIGLFISLVLSLFFIFGGRWFFSLFFKEEAILSYGVIICRFMTVIVLAQISQVIFGACLRAAGDVRYCLIATLVSVTFIRTAVTILLVAVIPLGLVGVWLGILSDQASRLLFLSHRFRTGKWVHLKI